MSFWLASSRPRRAGWQRAAVQRSRAKGAGSSSPPHTLGISGVCEKNIDKIPDQVTGKLDLTLVKNMMCVAIKPTKRSTGIICNISHKSKLSDAPTRLQRPAHAGIMCDTDTDRAAQRPERAWRGCRLTESSQLRRAHEYSVSAPLTPIRSTTSSTSPYALACTAVM